MKKIEPYDIVGNPGFKNARLYCEEAEETKMVSVVDSKPIKKWKTYSVVICSENVVKLKHKGTFYFLDKSNFTSIIESRKLKLKTL